MLKLFYILRTAPCSNNPRLSIFDDTLRQGLSTILNVSLSDNQWLQASLPVQKGGLVIGSAGMLATSASLASAAATLRPQNAILANSCFRNPDPAVGEALIIWKTQSHTEEPVSPADQYQKVWDNIVASSAVGNLVSRCNNKIDKARLKAAAAPHSGDWLNAISISSVGLRLSDEAIRVAVGHRLGSPTCRPHTYVCGGQVDARGLHG